MSCGSPWKRISAARQRWLRRERRVTIAEACSPPGRNDGPENAAPETLSRSARTREALEEGAATRQPTAPRKTARREARRARAQCVGERRAEVLAIGREMLAIPAARARSALRRRGARRWRFGPPAASPRRPAGAGQAGAAGARKREVTPARAVAAVAVSASLVPLAVAQFVDYREVRAGVPAYAEGGSIAPPPGSPAARDDRRRPRLPALLVSIATSRSSRGRDGGALARRGTCCRSASP